MSVLFITDIPAPYRVEMYNTMAESLPNLEVWYFQKESKARSWKFNQDRMRHKFWVAGGFYVRMGLYNLFVNPHLVFKLLLKQPRQVILAAGWNDFDVLCIVLLKRLGLIRSKIGFWSEANHLTLGASKDNAFKFRVRKFVYNTCDGFHLISGEMTRLTLSLWGVKKSREIFFPNTIEEDIHKVHLNETFGPTKNFNSDLPSILIAARLTERYKGIINFLNALSDAQLKKIKLFLAGDGNDRSKIESLVKSRRLENNVILLGNLTESEIGKLYSSVDAFCLPSFSDASPLTVIEALRWKLPLFISDRCGNHFEAVVPGLNGITFNPMVSKEIARSFDKFLSMKDKWDQMGMNSAKIYEDVFAKQKTITNFIQHIQGEEPH